MSTTLSSVLSLFPNAVRGVKLSLVDKEITTIDLVSSQYHTLEVLFLSNNYINNLTSLTQFSSLRILSLANNEISSIEQLHPLKTLTKLTVLNLSFNKVQQTVNYRAQVINMLPSLTYLDSADVSSADVSVAQKYVSREETLKNTIKSNHLLLWKLSLVQNRFNLHSKLILYNDKSNELNVKVLLEETCLTFIDQIPYSMADYNLFNHFRSNFKGKPKTFTSLCSRWLSCLSSVISQQTSKISNELTNLSDTYLSIVNSTVSEDVSITKISSDTCYSSLIPLSRHQHQFLNSFLTSILNEENPFELEQLLSRLYSEFTHKKELTILYFGFVKLKTMLSWLKSLKLYSYNLNLKQNCTILSKFFSFWYSSSKDITYQKRLMHLVNQLKKKINFHRIYSYYNSTRVFTTLCEGLLKEFSVGKQQNLLKESFIIWKNILISNSYFKVRLLRLFFNKCKSSLNILKSTFTQQQLQFRKQQILCNYYQNWYLSHQMIKFYRQLEVKRILDFFELWRTNWAQSCLDSANLMDIFQSKYQSNFTPAVSVSSSYSDFYQPEFKLNKAVYHDDSPFEQSNSSTSIEIDRLEARILARLS
ncbi:hypothetical protein P9112_005772 [Eukaryota sp. TZLM1-RC]